uniref:Neurotensin/neuromedin N n=1 Tax=Paramormyrops kingsleyae TaxID=1676925 RepID=A0A3B3SJB3_9TELE
LGWYYANMAYCCILKSFAYLTDDERQRLAEEDLLNRIFSSKVIENNESQLKQKSPYILKRHLLSSKSRRPYILKRSVWY